MIVGRFGGEIVQEKDGVRRSRDTATRCVFVDRSGKRVKSRAANILCDGPRCLVMMGLAFCAVNGVFDIPTMGGFDHQVVFLLDIRHTQ